MDSSDSESDSEELWTLALASALPPTTDGSDGSDCDGIYRFGDRVVGENKEEESQVVMQKLALVRRRAQRALQDLPGVFRRCRKAWTQHNGQLVQAANSLVNVHLRLSYVDDNNWGDLASSQARAKMAVALLAEADTLLARLDGHLDALGGVFAELLGGSQSLARLAHQGYNLAGPSFLSSSVLEPSLGCLPDFREQLECVLAMYRKELSVKHALASSLRYSEDGLTKERMEAGLCALLMEPFVDDEALDRVMHMLEVAAGVEGDAEVMGSP